METLVALEPVQASAEELRQAREQQLDEGAPLATEREQQVWTPRIMDRLSEEELADYIDLSCTSCVPGGGRNVEYALHVIYQSNGDLKLATSRLLNPEPEQQTLSSYPHTDAFNRWTELEVEHFERLVVEHEKNFFKIAKHLGSKTVKQCIEFYYIWKKTANHSKARFTDSGYMSAASVCDLSYSTNTTSSTSSTCNYQQQGAATNGSPHLANGLALALHQQQLNLLSLNGANHTSNGGNNKLPPLPTTDEVFPCKICGRVFEKIKSRSAHMKRHKNEASNKFKYS